MAVISLIGMLKTHQAGHGVSRFPPSGNGDGRIGSGLALFIATIGMVDVFSTN